MSALGTRGFSMGEDQHGKNGRLKRGILCDPAVLVNPRLSVTFATLMTFGYCAFFSIVISSCCRKLLKVKVFSSRELELVDDVSST